MQLYLMQQTARADEAAEERRSRQEDRQEMKLLMLALFTKGTNSNSNPTNVWNSLRDDGIAGGEEK
jgi:hypothetical protein